MISIQFLLVNAQMVTLVIYAAIHVIVLMVPHVLEATVLAAKDNVKLAGPVLTVTKVGESYTRITLRVKK